MWDPSRKTKLSVQSIKSKYINIQVCQNYIHVIHRYLLKCVFIFLVSPVYMNKSCSIFSEHAVVRVFKFIVSCVYFFIVSRYHDNQSVAIRTLLAMRTVDIGRNMWLVWTQRLGKNLCLLLMCDVLSIKHEIPVNVHNITLEGSVCVECVLLFITQ